MVDSETRLDNSVASPKNVFQYNYTLVNLLKETLDIESIIDQIEPSIINHVEPEFDQYVAPVITLFGTATIGYYFK